MPLIFGLVPCAINDARNSNQFIQVFLSVSCLSRACLGKISIERPKWKHHQKEPSSLFVAYIYVPVAGPSSVCRFHLRQSETTSLGTAHAAPQPAHPRTQTAQTALVLSFPRFVPSLSWQNDRQETGRGGGGETAVFSTVNFLNTSSGTTNIKNH